jgi:hypothetical protein
VNYRDQLARSGELRLVENAYRQACLSLDADLRRLNAAPRVRADASAAAWLNRYSVPAGATPVPRLNTGRWPALNPARLNAGALGLPAAYQQVIDWVSVPTTVTPAFVTDQPGRLLRPSPHTRY